MKGNFLNIRIDGAKLIEFACDKAMSSAKQT